MDLSLDLKHFNYIDHPSQRFKIFINVNRRDIKNYFIPDLLHNENTGCPAVIQTGTRGLKNKVGRIQSNGARDVSNQDKRVSVAT